MSYLALKMAKKNSKLTIFANLGQKTVKFCPFPYLSEFLFVREMLNIIMLELIAKSFLKMKKF